MSSSLRPAANYTRLSGIFNTTIQQAEQIVGYTIEAFPAAGFVQFFDGATVVAQFNIPASPSNLVFKFIDLPAALVNASGLRIVSPDAATIITVFWL
jgi:hypothetical protein